MDLFGFAAIEAMAPERTVGFCAASCAFDCEIEGESRSATFEQSHACMFMRRLVALPLPRFRSVAAFACLHARDLRPGEGCL